MHRTLLATPLAILISATFIAAAAGPATAGTASDCTAQAQNVRAKADTASPDAARRALETISVGEKLCAAGNERAAAKKFRQADQTIELARIPTIDAAAQ